MQDPLTLAFVMGYDTKFWFAENARRAKRNSCSQVFRTVALATQPTLTPPTVPQIPHSLVPSLKPFKAAR